MQANEGIVDFHAHLGDVCSGCYEEPVRPNRSGLIQPHLLEKTAYHPLLIKFLNSKFLPKSVLVSSARRSGEFASVDNLVLEMKKSHVERSVVLPIAPFVETLDILQLCRRAGSSLTPLLSVNFTSPLPIETQVRALVKEYPFKGIKFHPNLQAVSLRSKETETLFGVAERENLFILIHGGTTPVLESSNRDYATADHLIPALKAFPRVRFIVAHCGSYFCAGIPKEFLNAISQMPNVLLETSGVDPNVILNALRSVGSERMVFGSDWPYATQSGSIAIVRKAVLKFCKEMRSDPDSMLNAILIENGAKLLR